MPLTNGKYAPLSERQCTKAQHKSITVLLGELQTNRYEQNHIETH